MQCEFGLPQNLRVVRLGRSANSVDGGRAWNWGVPRWYAEEGESFQLRRNESRKKVIMPCGGDKPMGYMGKRKLLQRILHMDDVIKYYAKPPTSHQPTPAFTS